MNALFDKLDWNHLLMQHRYALSLSCSTDMRLRVASGSDRSDIINVINSVAGEHKYLQTDRYRPTPAWEKLLSEGMNIPRGLLLLVIEDQDTLIGFARLYPDEQYPRGCRTGNVGIALLPLYRSKGIGAIILKVLAACAIALDYEVLTADILESNLCSKKLFSRLGFRRVKCRNIYLDFLHEHVNELYYELELSQLWEAKTS